MKGAEGRAMRGKLCALHNNGEEKEMREGNEAHTVVPGLRALDLTLGERASRALRNADRTF